MKKEITTNKNKTSNIATEFKLTCERRKMEDPWNNWGPKGWTIGHAPNITKARQVIYAHNQNWLDPYDTKD